MSPLRRAPALRLAVLAAALLAAAARGEPVVEYLTVEAAENGASGGHAALRLGERVYHFEAEDGRLRLAREPWPDWRFRYRVLENRTLRAQRVDADPGAAAALARHFDRRLWSETFARERLAALQDDVRILGALVRGGPTDATVPVPGAGFFEDAPAPRASAGADALRALARRIARERAPGFAGRRLREARAALRDLRPGEPDGAFSRRWVELVAAASALEVLRDARPLRTGVTVALPADVAALSPAERRALDARRHALETELVRLAGSQRPDWGAAFALGLARLAALAESLDTAHLVVLDALPADAPRLDPARVRQAAERLRTHRSRTREVLARARRALVGGGGERALARLEAAASRHAELARALDDGAGLRVAADPLAPRRVGRVAVGAALPRLAREAAADALADARARLRAERDAFDARHGYDLFTHNCVTAIFREMEAATADRPGALARPDPRTGPVERAVRALRFVPFVSAHEAARRWRVAETRVLPSHREERLAALRERQAGWRVALRESNTLTSTLYAPHPADSAFLFFTDDRVWTRPLLGAANLVAGLAHGVAGVLRLPWDGGREVARGARGALASVPELVFVSIRKGSFPFEVPPAAPEQGARMRAAAPAYTRGP